jgi:hypothetical protein
MKRLAVILAIAVVLASGTIFAAGQLTGVKVSGTETHEWYSNGLDPLKAYEPRYVDEFPCVRTGAAACTITATVTATGFSPGASSTLAVANGGTNLTAAADDNVMVGNGTTWQSKALTTCTDTAGQHLNYDASTNVFSCGVSIPAADTPLRGATGSIGGGALTASCASGTATVTGAATGAHYVSASPSVDITGGNTTAFSVLAYVSSSSTVTVRVCGTGTPTSTTYNVVYIP